MKNLHHEVHEGHEGNTEGFLQKTFFVYFVVN